VQEEKGQEAVRYDGREIYIHKCGDLLYPWGPRSVLFKNMAKIEKM
jgi:hypothetical protein